MILTLIKTEKPCTGIMKVIIPVINNCSDPPDDHPVPLQQKESYFGVSEKRVLLGIYKFFLLHYQSGNPLSAPSVMVIGKVYKLLNLLLFSKVNNLENIWLNIHRRLIMSADSNYLGTSIREWPPSSMMPCLIPTFRKASRMISRCSSVWVAI